MLANRKQCSACGACVEACSKKAITMVENKIGEIYPVINHNKCIECKICIKNCPILTPLETHKPYKAYCAFSTSADTRLNSASGGVAMTAYQYALNNGYYVVGASQDKDFLVRLKVVDNVFHAKTFQNSKYVFSQGWDSFSKIKKLLKAGHKVLIIALPCQIAAIRSLCRDNENLLCGEVICHGTTPTSYLLQHIHKIENEYGQKVVEMSFRDPAYETSKFFMTFYNEKGECFYAKRTIMGDNYQYGYHRNISYRNSCYNCYFANINRHADFTLNDYKQLGKCAPTNLKQLKNNSTILINTPKGEAFIKNLIDSKLITIEERPIEEPINADPRISLPTMKTPQRIAFEKAIDMCNGDFEAAIAPLEVEWRKEAIKKERIKKINNNIKKIVKKYICRKK